MKYLKISGIYPHMAVTHEDDNYRSNECGIGAVVNYGEKLWFVTYPASDFEGGQGRIYRVDGDINTEVCPESTGGTHADRFVHSVTRIIRTTP